MAPVRLRHPKGVSTLQISLDNEQFTVQDLQQEIYKTTDILPSRQVLKCGYPPRSLTIVPELSISSLGLTPGEPIIVSESADSTARPQPAPSQPISPTRAVPARVVNPPKSAAPAPRKTDSKQPEHVNTDGGVLIHRVVPDDNSCLFSSVALIFEQDIAKAPKLREIVANGIKKDAETYNEGILGMPPSTYISTIMKPSSWGGAIELGILASHYRTEIASIDVETGRIDHFSPPEKDSTGMRCVVLYSGIHYDAVSVSPMLDAPGEWHQTVFPAKSPDASDPILIGAKKLADQLRAKKAFTNTSTFDLKCEDCGQGLKGEKGARAHAAETGHVKFGEY